MVPAIRILLLREDASNDEKMEMLKRLEMEFRDSILLLKKMTKHVEESIDELERNKTEHHRET